MDTVKAAYGDKIAIDEAVDLLSMWAESGTEHGILFQSNYRAMISARVTISKVSEAHLICQQAPASFVFGLHEAEFILGPMMRMEYPEKKDSKVRGLHIYLTKNAGYLFISDTAELPASALGELPSL